MITCPKTASVRACLPGGYDVCHGCESYVANSVAIAAGQQQSDKWFAERNAEIAAKLASKAAAASVAPVPNEASTSFIPSVGDRIRFRTWQELLNDPEVHQTPNGKLFVPSDGGFQFVCGPSGFYVHEQWDMLGTTHVVTGVSSKGSIRLEGDQGWWNHISKLFAPADTEGQ